MNNFFVFPVVPQLPPGQAVPLATVGTLSVLVVLKIFIKIALTAVGLPGIPLAELGTDVTRLMHYIAAAGGAPPAQNPALQPALLQALQQALQPMQNQLQGLQNQLQDLRQMMVESHNTAARSYNWRAHASNDRQKPLRKERQPGAPNAAAFGALPAAGVFPATRTAVYNMSHAQVNELAIFYEEDFGNENNMLRVQRCSMFLAFITTVE